MADSTAAIQAAIDAATGNANPATTSRGAKGPVFLPGGTYKITSDLTILSVTEFKLIGMGGVTFKASGTGFTNAVLYIDGSLNGDFEGIYITGDGTEQVTSAVQLTWTTAAQRSTSANTFKHINVKGLNHVTGFNLAGVGTRQLDGTRFYDCVTTGGQLSGTWSNSGNWQNGFLFGNGSWGNIYDHVLYGCGAAGYYYGWNCNVSSFALYGSQPGYNAVDFYITASAQTTIENVQSQASGQLLVTGADSGSDPISLRDITFKGGNASTPNWIQIYGAGASQKVLLENVVNAMTTYSPVIALDSSGGTTYPSLTMIKVRQNNSLTSGVTAAAYAVVSVIDYMDTSTTPRTITPFASFTLGATCTSGGFAIPKGIAGAQAASRYVGATTGGAPASGTYALGDFVIDQTGSIYICTTAGTVGSGCAFTQVAGAKAPDIQFFSTPGSNTWTKPAGAQSVEVVLLASGGGGGGGATTASGVAVSGGGGGGGGGIMNRSFRASDLSSSVTINLGAVGAGGASVSGTSTNGNNGTLGLTSSFGSYMAALAGSGGIGGKAGSATNGFGGLGTGPGSNAGAGVQGAAGNGSNAAVGGAGGGGGGGISTTPAAFNGGAAAYSISGTASNTGAAGVVDTTLPTAGSAITVAGTAACGGGGGAASITTNAQSGATAYYGGGGGGGGSALNGNNSGAGGNGGPACCLVITHFS